MPELSGRRHPARRWLDERFSLLSSDAVRITPSKFRSGAPLHRRRFALAWVLRNLQVTAVVVSVTSLGELHESFGASDLALTNVESCELAKITTAQDYRMELRHA